MPCVKWRPTVIHFYRATLCDATTLVDPEMTLDGNYALRCITHVCFGANH